MRVLPHRAPGSATHDLVQDQAAFSGMAR
jgi:hypothetical protein